MEEVGSCTDFVLDFYKLGPWDCTGCVLLFYPPKNLSRVFTLPHPTGLFCRADLKQPLILWGGWLSFDTRQTNWFIDWLIDYCCLDLLPENTDWRNKWRVNIGPLGSCAAGSRAKIGPDAHQCQQAAEWLQGSGWAFFFIWVPGQKC